MNVKLLQDEIFCAKVESIIKKEKGKEQPPGKRWEAIKKKVQAAAKATVGETGITRSAMRPYGTVEIGGSLVEAMIEGDYAQTGTRIRVREVRGEKIIVEAV